MSKVICEREDLVAVADAVRSKTGTTEEMTLGEVTSGIYSISGGSVEVVQTTGNSTTSVMSQKAVTDAIDQLSEEIVDQQETVNSLTLGIASDGLIYLFVDGNPKGTGIPQGQSGDVFGYVDENNTIVLTGKLAEDTYFVKYEKEGGGTIDIGELELIPTPTYTNLAKPNDASWKVPYRINSSYAEKEETSYPALVTTNYIEVKKGDVIRVKNIDFKATSYISYSRIIQYNNGTGVNFLSPQSNDAEFVVGGNGVTTITVKNTSPWTATFTHIRLCGKLTGSSADVIITKNEEIV